MKKHLPHLEKKPSLPERLPARLLALLTLALLPIGLIAVLQTMAVVKEVERLGERDILVRTADAANAELAVIQRAIGAAQGLAAVAAAIGPTSPECETIMADFIERTPPYVLAIFIDTQGVSTCSSRGAPADLRESPILKAFLENPGLKIDFTEKGRVTGGPVIVSMVPVHKDGKLIGAVSISIPHSLSETLLANQIEDVEVAVVDQYGKILSASNGIDNAQAFRDSGIVPGELEMAPLGVTYTDRTEDGREGTMFAVVPLIRGEVFVVGRWSSDATAYATSVFGTPTPTFPILMWLASLFVAYLAIDRLVLRHLNALRTRMAQFSLDRPERNHLVTSYAPAEVAEISESFNVMIDRIIEDHARLEDSVREKDILLKEVHHRVKNNLQLIASILNMQLRSIHTEEARHVLKRVQDRVIGLSLIHKLLYTDTRVDAVDADALLGEIIQSVQTFSSDSDDPSGIEMDLSPVTLDPDQAVPLSLLVTEALTNALKYADKSSDSYIRVTLKAGEAGKVFLRVANSKRADAENVRNEGTGLGTRLIQAFVSQLGGDIQITDTESAYAIDVVFTKLGAEPLPRTAAA